MPNSNEHVIPTTRLELVLSFLICLLLTGFYFLPILSDDFTLSGADLVVFFIPFRQIWVELALQGHFPLWDPFTSSGNPLFATLQGAILYPLSLLFLFLDFFQAFNLQFIFHYALAGFSMYWLLRRSPCSRVGSAIGALALMFGGYLFSLKFYLSTLFPVVWAPLLLLCFFGGWFRNDKRLAFASALISVFMLFAGGAETCYQIFAWLILFSLFPQLLFPKQTLPDLKTRLAYLGCFLFFFFGLSAIQALPTSELIANSVRSESFDIGRASRWNVHMRDWLQFLILDPYGYIAFMDSTEDGQAWMQTQYVGAIPLLLGGFYLVKGGVRAWTLLLVITVSWALALGQDSLLYRAFFDILPWFDRFRYPVKFVLPLVLVLSLIAGWGWDRFYQLPPNARFKAALLGFATLAMIAFGLLDSCGQACEQWMDANGFNRPEYNRTDLNLYNLQRLLGFTSLFMLALYFIQRSSNKKMVWAACALLIFFLDIFFSNQGNYEVNATRNLTEIRPTTQFLRNDPSLFRTHTTIESELSGSASKRNVRGVNITGATFPIEFRNQAGIAQLDGWNVIRKTHLKQLMRIVSARPLKDRLALLRMANVKYIVHAGAEPLDFLPLAFEEPDEYRKELEAMLEHPPPPIRVYENPGWLGRAFLSGNCRALPDGSELNYALWNPKWEPTRTVLLPESPPELPCDADSNEPGEGTVTPIAIEPDLKGFRVRSEKKQFLVMSDSFYPGWVATVGGKEVTVHRANQAFRAIVVPAGSFDVLFEFRPESFRTGMWISGISFLIGMIFLGYLSRQRH